MTDKGNITWGYLGDYIETTDERNSKGFFGEADVRGISVEKKIIPTHAALDGVSLAPYKVFRPKTFSFVTVTSRNGDKITITMNDTEQTFIVSSLYVVFRIKNPEVLLPEFLFMWFNRSEFDRYCRVNSWGSAREYFWYEDICRVRIPIPSVEAQRRAITIWKGIRKIKDDNLSIATPLIQLCESYIQELKHAVSAEPIGPFIKRGVKNTDGRISRVLGIGQSGFIEPQKIPNESLKNYKILSKDMICYAPPLYNIKSDAIHLYTQEDAAVCSPIYEVFECDKSRLLPEYLMLWLKREEFKRYAEYYALGVRNTFSYNLMEELRIPIPSIEVQKAVVDIYVCAQEAKRIASKADSLSRTICPALMQIIIHS